MEYDIERSYFKSRPDQPLLCSSIRDVMLQCMSSTSAHGMPRAFLAHHRPVRCLWTVVFFSALLMFVLHCCTLFDSYLQYPINTAVDYHGEPFTFPDVTICNLVPYSLLDAEKSGASLTDAEDIERLQEQTSNKPQNVILQCIYNRKNCSYQDFLPVHDPILSQCYRFAPSNRHLESCSPEFGLNLILFAESRHPHDVQVSDELLESQSSGVRLIIHEPDSHPHPELSGIDIRTGVKALISLNIEAIEQLPNQNCYADDPGSPRRSIQICNLHNKRITSYQYSNEDCYGMRIQEILMEQCGCLSPKYDIPAAYCDDNSEVLIKLQINSSSVEHCSTNSPQQSSCLKEVSDEINRNYIRMVAQFCKSPCQQRSWRKQISVGKWPSYFAEQQITKSIRQLSDGNYKGLPLSPSLRDLISESSDKDMAKLFSHNLVQVSVYAESLTGKKVVESPAYTTGRLLGDIGGVLGLWLGGSVLTLLIEPFELVFRIFLLIFDRRKFITTRRVEPSGMK